jgi:hypothetical protein
MGVPRRESGGRDVINMPVPILSGGDIAEIAVG